MADIPIQRKEGRAIWPWILGAIILLLLIWFLMSRRRGNETTATRSDSTVTTTDAGAVTGAGGAMAGTSSGTSMGASAAVTEYANWVGTVDPNRDETKQHAYTAGGIRRLADALAAEGATGAGLDNMRKQADALENSSANSTNHADMARSAFLSAADIFDSLKSSNRGLDATKVRSAAEAMKPGPHLLQQKDKVQSFFESARDALQGISRTNR